MRKIVTTCTALALSAVLYSQAYVADTIYINYGNQLSKQKINISVSDIREDHPHTISVYEKKKWLFFPVDQIIKLQKPLAEEMERCFDTQQDPEYHIKIHNFYYKQSENILKRTFKLNASIELYQQQNKNSSLMGVFYYQKYHTQKAKDSITTGYLTAIDSFNTEFSNDLAAVIQNKDINTDKKYHFRRGYAAADKNFYTTTDVFYGLGFWGFDAELYFSYPEADKKFKRNSRMMRYMHFENRQSIAIARKINYWNIRLDERWIFRNKYAFLMGFNKWNDIAEENRTFEELFLFQVTASQKITYNKLDKSGFVFGGGLFEEVSYTPYNKPFINVGIIGTLGYKF